MLGDRVMPRLADLAVIIPVGPGDRSWHDLLPQLHTLPAPAEVVMVLADGDSQSLTAVSARTQVLRCAAGRARQQNAGVAASHRPWIWLLHADSRLDAQALAAIEGLAAVETLAYFDLHFHDGSALMSLTALGTRLRSRLFGLPFGDQGFLLPRHCFLALGGFDEALSGGEDHALVWAARRAGLPLHALDARIATSARRYQEHGWWRTTARHLRLTWSQARQFAKARPSHQ